MSVTRKDHLVQIVVAIIGAVAVLLAAVITPLVSNLLKDEDVEREVPPKSEQRMGAGEQGHAAVPLSGLPEQPGIANSQTEDEPNKSAGAIDGGKSAHIEVPQNRSPEMNNDPVETLTVFENTGFSLCGIQDFKASLKGVSDGKSLLRIASSDRSIPGSSFRGYTKIVPTEAIVQLWPDCNVRFRYEQKAGVARIEVSRYGSY